MKDKIFSKLFGKGGDNDVMLHLPEDERALFALMIDDIEIGRLECEAGTWTFVYSDKFRNEYSLEYERIIGFPKLDKVYQKDSLWPFFLTRIPGLKQPAIKEILEKEKIDGENEAALLKRFGRRSISNPYELIAC